MSWVEKIRTKSNKEKIKIIWTTVAVVFVVLVAFWIAIGNYNYGNVNKDTTIFHTLGQSIKDFNQQIRK